MIVHVFISLKPDKEGKFGFEYETAVYPARSQRSSSSGLRSVTPPMLKRWMDLAS